MLRQEATVPHKLKYVTYGTRQSRDRVRADMELESRYCELYPVIITDDFRHDVLVDTLRFYEAPSEVKGTKRIYSFGIRVRVEWGDAFIQPIVKFEVGKKLNDFQIHHLLAAEFDTSISTVRRTLAAHSFAREIE
jgi:hypothetical protein